LQGLQEISVVKKQIKEWMAADRPDKDKISLLEQQVAEVEGIGGGRRGRGPSTGQPGFATLEGRLATLGGIWQESDRLPTRQSIEAMQETLQALGAVQIKWGQLKTAIEKIQ
jgi:hypothetical protein